MKKNIKNFIILLLLGTYIFLYVFYILDRYLKYSDVITSSVVMIITFIAFLFYGFAKDKNNYAKKSIKQIIITQLIVYFLVTYILGLVVGFLKNAYSLQFFSIIDNIFAPIVLLISLELLRYMYITHNKDNKLKVLLLTILLIFFEVSMNYRAYDLSELLGVFRFITLVVLPVSFKQFLLSYLTYCVGYKPPLIYSLIMDGYIFLVPIIPDLGDYLTSMFGLGVPFLVYMYSARFLREYDNGIEREFNNTTFRPSDFVYIVFFVILAGLISGYFPAFMVGVGSASMSPKVNVGDAVIAVKVTDKDLKKNDIIIYNRDNKLIVHRIKEIYKKNNKNIYYTKGDNNNTLDDVELSISSIKGKVILRIPYIAYPAVYISELFNREG